MLAASLAGAPFVGTGWSMSRKLKKQGSRPPVADNDEVLAPITAMMSSRLIVLANLLKRGAMLRYKRLAGLSSVEFGLVASLGRRPPMSVISLAEAVGMDKGQISRALAELVSRKLVAKAVNPRDNREVLVSLTRTGLGAHDAIVAGAQERNRRLLEQMSEGDLATLLSQVDRLTKTAAEMLAAEKELD
jgi:DNA-binding MarR family transcriptional regulator